MKNILKKAVLGMLILGCSSVALADDCEGVERYSEVLNEQYNDGIEIIEGIEDAELELEKAGELLILEVEIEAEKSLSNEAILDAIEPVVAEAVQQVKDDYDNNLRLVVERDDEIIRSEGF